MEAATGYAASGTDSPRRSAESAIAINAVAETINGLYKTELIKAARTWRTSEQIEVAALEWADWFNHRRINNYCANTLRADYETLYDSQNRTQHTTSS
ncbi:hypothetical protein [Mycobacterium marinum]|uniref:hypothetical protein n=1 Tax=Mycobacterium marinum TaxID=1781 RepID=UPI00192330C2|nr:hypothetical protein HXW97_18695 [Mycobacterium marinum]